MVYDEYVSHKLILLIVPPILLAVGSLGNLFSFIILFKNLGKASTYTYLCALALLDLLVLYVGLLRIWIGQFITDVLDTSNILCKTGTFFGYVCSDTSVWLIVAVTIERFIAVMFPLKAPRLCSRRNAHIAIVGLILTFVAVNSHFLWSVEIHHYSFNRTVISKCHAKAVFGYLVEDVWPWIDAGIYSFVPFLIIIISNIFIIKNIISAKHTRSILRQKSSISTRKGTINSNRTRGESSKKITLMLLSVSFTFLISTLPMNLVLIYTSFADDVEEDDVSFVRRKLLKTIAEMLMYVNHTVNFFLYCMTGKKFRDQFKALVCSHRLRFRTNSQRFSSTSLRLSTKTTRRAFEDTVHDNMAAESIQL